MQSDVARAIADDELDPTFILARVFLGQAYEQLGVFSSAIAEFEKVVELPQRHPTYLADLGHGYAIAGRRADALRTLDELTEMSSQRYVGREASRRSTLA
jgi:Flp pilus assembly protein TadD